MDRGSSRRKNSDFSELRIVLIGGLYEGRSSGKSSVGNLILGRDAFKTTNTVTSNSVMEKESVEGRRVIVVNAPGWESDLPLDLTPKLTQLEIQKSVTLCPLGPHAFILVVRLDQQYTGTWISAEEHVGSLLGDRAWKHTIVVFTVADKKKKERRGLIKSDPDLKDLTEKCEDRYHVLDISDKGDGSQVTKLLEKVDQISNGDYYKVDPSVSEELEKEEQTIQEKAKERTDALQQSTGPPKSIGRQSDFRIVLLGRYRSGKSTVGSTILQGSDFEIGQSHRCMVGQGKVAGKDVTVVDTRGWFYNSPLQNSSEMDKLEIQNSVSLCPPGPHAVLLAVPLHRAFTKEMRVAVEEHMALLSPSVWSHTIVLFTAGDRLGNRSIEQHIVAEGEDLCWLVDQCGNRYHVFNMTDDSQVTQLLEKIEMMSGNTGRHYELDGDIREKMSERKKKMEEGVKELTKKLATLEALPEGERLDNVRLVLAGGKQIDRNRAGNRILQRTAFKETLCKEFKTQSKLTKCVREWGEVAKRKVSVVICPDWSTTTPPSQETKDVLQELDTMCSPGPHAVLVTVDVQSSFSEADKRSVEEHMKLLGDRVWEHALVLFMWGYWLGGRSVVEYIVCEGEHLMWLLEKCGYRYHVLNGNEEELSEVEQLMKTTDDMVTKNGGHFKSDESRVTAETASLFSGLNTEGETTPTLQQPETEYYTLTHNPRGTCLIINNMEFKSPGLKNRSGTEQDEEALKRVFSKLGFDVKVHANKEAKHIRDVLEELVKQDFTEADALVVCVLSHGGMGCVFGTDGAKVLLKELMKPFRSSKAPTLAGKPKLFFIQACQGSDCQQGVLPPTPTPSKGQGGTLEKDTLEKDTLDERIPDDADFLMGIASVDSYVSFRNPKEGSIYIQELCNQLEKRAASGGDIVRVLTAVNREVAGRKFTDNGHKQMPGICLYTLTKTLELRSIDTAST